MELKILNSILKSPIKPAVTNAVTMIGNKLTRTNSTRLKNIQSIIIMAIEE